MYKLRKWSSAAALSLCQAVWAMQVLFPTPSQAGSFQVSPVGVQLAPRERAAALHLSNTGDQTLTLRAEVMQWSQGADGQDWLEPSNDLVLSPPVIVLPPGARQVVRLARLVPPQADQTRSYRLIIREVTPQDLATPESGQIPVLLGMSLPVLLTPPQPMRKVACEPQSMHASGMTLVCTNEGNVVTRVLRVELGPPSAPVARYLGATYWLPGSRHRVDLRSTDPLANGPHPVTVWFDDDQTTSFNVTVP